jgi:hypothetical protein
LNEAGRLILDLFRIVFVFHLELLLAFVFYVLIVNVRMNGRPFVQIIRESQLDTNQSKQCYELSLLVNVRRI